MPVTTHQGTVRDGLGNTPHVAGDVVLSAGFGTTATISAITSDDSGGSFSAASSGTGQGANPTATLTFKEAYVSTPKVGTSRGDIAAAAGDWRATTIAAGSVVFTFVGTPVAGQTYICRFKVS